MLWSLEMRSFGEKSSSYVYSMQLLIPANGGVLLQAWAPQAPTKEPGQAQTLFICAFRSLRAEACLSLKKGTAVDGSGRDQQFLGCPGPQTHQVFQAGFASLAEDTKLRD